MSQYSMSFDGVMNDKVCTNLFYKLNSFVCQRNRMALYITRAL